MKKFYSPKVEEPDEFTWRVFLIGDTGKPITWVNVDKSEYPTKQEAIDYLVDRYENEIGDYDMRVAHTKGMIPTRMIEGYIERKKNRKKPKTKRCRCKK